MSLVGFAMTVWTVLKAIEVNERTRAEIKSQVDAVRQETKNLLAKIRTRSMEDAREQANLFAREAKHAIKFQNWHMAAVRCRDARQLAMRLLEYHDLAEDERISIRRVVEDLPITASFIERNRLRPKAPASFPLDKSEPLDALIDALEGIRSRMHQRLLEMPSDDG